MIFANMHKIALLAVALSSLAFAAQAIAGSLEGQSGLSGLQSTGQDIFAASLYLKPAIERPVTRQDNIETANSPSKPISKWYLGLFHNPRQDFSYGKTYIIRGVDNGGEIIKYALRVKEMEKHKTQLQIKGSCYSACTLYLSLPKKQLCISPNSKFVFHKPHGVGRSSQIRAANFLMKSYPSWVISWIRKNGGLRTANITMTADYAGKHLEFCDN